jgi:hypothetical protein
MCELNTLLQKEVSDFKTLWNEYYYSELNLYLESEEQWFGIRCNTYDPGLICSLSCSFQQVVPSFPGVLK